MSTERLVKFGVDSYFQVVLVVKEYGEPQERFMTFRRLMSRTQIMMKIRYENKCLLVVVVNDVPVYLAAIPLII